MNRFLQRYQNLAGREIKKIQVAQCIRINTLRIAEKEILSRLKKKGVVLEKVPYLQYGYLVKSSPFSVGSTPEYLQGYYYLQSASSQIPVQVLDPQPGETILDMCAAPGSKTTQIAQHMENTGTLVALEAVAPRLQVLRNNVMRMGVTNTGLFHKDGRSVSDLKVQFDRIIVDAPCSGNFILEEDWFEKRTESDFLRCASTQRQLLLAASSVLKVGGTLVYSTCSLEPEENEEVVQWVLEELDLELQDIHVPFPAPGVTQSGEKHFSAELRKTLRIWPDIIQSEGFFVAKFVRKL